MSADPGDSDDEGAILQYAGVLKKPPPSQKKAQTPRATLKVAPTTLRRLGGKFKLPPADAPASPSPSAEAATPAKLSVLRRLGKPPAAVPSAADTQDNKVTTSTPPRAPKTHSRAAPTAGGDSAGAQMDMRAISVFKRLGNKRT